MPTLVILHGWMQNKTIWEPFIEQISSTIGVHAIDLPGFGSEPLQSTDWGIPEYAQFVIRYIEQQKLTDVILLGHSFGGRIAAFIASKQPLWLKGLILYAAPALYRPSATIKRKIFIAKLLKFLRIKRKFITNSELREADQNGLGKIFRTSVTFDQTTLLPNIAVSTHLIWGNFDDSVPLRIANEMNTLIPQSKLTVLDGMGHNIHLDNPPLFYGTIKNILKTF